ncbi:MAG: RnfABCDGE type electron transport complex subunit D [Planctomycetes bacterium]|nr:RnfABCDGE type electron transport complex subunit D [Planctomycetota bacterium]
MRHERTSHDAVVSLPEPGTLRIGPAPHGQGRPGLVPITVTFTVAAGLAAAAGVVLFGWHAVRVLAISVSVALLVESLFNAMKGRSPSWSESHALLIGLLFACTLPPTVSWRVVVAGSFITVIVGEALSGGVGNYLWHPVALGRVAVQMLFHRELSPEHWPVLGPGHLVWGNLGRAAEMPRPGGRSSHPLPQDAEAWLVSRTDDLLRTALPTAPGAPADGLTAFVRDLAPSWWDTISGAAGGGVGEACVAALLVAAGLLIWRGFLRWPMAATAIVVAGAAAAVLPARVQTPDGMVASCTVPGLALRDGLPVGIAYVLYHLTAGGLPLVGLLLAPDPSSSPLTSRGHLMFGAIIGLLTILLRVEAGLPAAAYWALLAANTLVPTINRLTRRRVFGT